MSDLLARLVMVSVYLWAGVEMLRVGEKATVWVRGLILAGSAAGVVWWALLAVYAPEPSAFSPWWTGTSRVAPILVMVGVAIIARRRREINGYH